MHQQMKFGTIIRREPESAGNGGSPSTRAFVVIVARTDEPHLPFVCWYERPETATEPAQYWSGDYCATLTEACQSFTRRTGKEA